MKKLLTFTGIALFVALLGFNVLAPFANAQYYNYYDQGNTYPSYYPGNTDLNSWGVPNTNYYYPNSYQTYSPDYYYYGQQQNAQYYYGQQTIPYQQPTSSYYGYTGGANYYGASAYGFYGQTTSWNTRSNNDDRPDVETLSARDIEDNSAELRGEVDMNDARNGRVFFVYGEDRNDIEDVEDEDQYNDIDESGDDIQKVLVDSDLDNREDYDRNVSGLDDDTRIYFRICVEYEDEDNDDRLECGDVENFRTDN